MKYSVNELSLLAHETGVGVGQLLLCSTLAIGRCFEVNIEFGFHLERRDLPAPVLAGVGIKRCGRIGRKDDNAARSISIVSQCM